jgi:hypothetical protein
MPYFGYLDLTTVKFDSDPVIASSAMRAEKAGQTC